MMEFFMEFRNAKSISNVLIGINQSNIRRLLILINIFIFTTNAASYSATVQLYSEKLLRLFLLMLSSAHLLRSTDVMSFMKSNTKVLFDFRSSCVKMSTADVYVYNVLIRANIACPWVSITLFGIIPNDWIYFVYINPQSNTGLLMNSTMPFDYFFYFDLGQQNNSIETIPLHHALMHIQKLDTSIVLLSPFTRKNECAFNIYLQLHCELVYFIEIR